MKASVSKRGEMQPSERLVADGNERKPLSAGAAALLGALHRTSGNQAVGRLLDAFAGKPPPEAGEPLDEATRQDMEDRFGDDFREVRLHTEGAAAATARDAGAKAFTSGSDVSFAPGVYRAGDPASRTLLAHELAHVLQQSKGGARPEAGADTAHEQEAEATAQRYSTSASTLNVSAATGVGMACSVDDWLNGTPDISKWRYTDLVDERTELQQWMDRHTVMDDEALRIEEALTFIEARIAELDKGVVAPAKKRSKKATRKGKRKGASEAEAPAADDMQPPRCLVERQSTQYEDVEEAREEFDRIVAWLQRKDVSADDRRVLQMELDNLAPQVGQGLQQKAVERRQERIRRALTPTGAGDARARIREAVELIDSIKPVSGNPDQYYLMHGGEMIYLTADEAAGIRAATIAALDDAVKKVKRVNDDAFDRVDRQAAIDREESFAAWGVSLFTDKTTWELLDEFLPINAKSDDAVSRYHGAKRRGDLLAMADELANAEEFALRGKLLADAHIQDIQTTGENVITGLQITSAAAFTIVMIGTAGAAAPAISAGLTGAGITGAAGTTLTVAGTAGVVGAEGFALGGGSAMGGELAAGHSWSEASAAGWEQGKKWGETGLKIGASAAAAPLVAARFGVGAEGVGTVGNIVRSGAAAGTTNVAVEAGAKGLLHQELLSPTEAGLAFGGGFVGGSTGPLTQKIASPALRGVTNVAIGAGSSGAMTYAETGDANQALQAAAVGGATALGTSKSARPSDKTLNRANQIGQDVRAAAKSAKNKAAGSLRATMLGFELSGAAPQTPSGSGGGIRAPALTAAATAGAGKAPPVQSQTKATATTSASSAAQPAKAKPASAGSKAAGKTTPSQAKASEAGKGTGSKPKAAASAKQTKQPATGAAKAGKSKAASTAKKQGKQAVAAAKTPKPATANAAKPKAASAAKKQSKQPGTPAKSKAAGQPAAKRTRRAKVDVSKQTLDERIDAKQLELQASRKKTSDYFEQRRQAGRSEKGGPKKGIDNAKEQIWLLKRQKAYPDRQILTGCEVKGVRHPDGTLTPSRDIAGTGRDPDFVEFTGSKATMGELKSEWELNKSLSGGPGTRQGGQTSVAPSSKMGGQFTAEDSVIDRARAVGGKVVVTGYDLRTGKHVELVLDPDQMSRAIFSSTAGWGIGSEWSN